MKYPILTILLLTPFPVLSCEVEDWRWKYVNELDLIEVEGTTTCLEGQFSLRFYDKQGDEEEFVGVDTAFISGNIFNSFLDGILEKPENLVIRYTVK